MTAGSTADRLRRLLAILAWLAQVGEASIDDTARRFDLSPEALVAELEMAACCGVPPYTPDQLMEILVTENTVSVHVGAALARPRRLSPSEGLALATAARALLTVPGSDEDGALSRALAKLDRALGGDGLGVELDAPERLPLVREALRGHRLLRISYYSASSDRVTEREILPLRLLASEGHWYVDGWCRSAGDLRRFRVDRIGAAEIVPGELPPEVAHVAANDPVADGEVPDDPTGQAGGTAFQPFVPGPDSRRVRLSLDPSALWLVESVPAAGPPVPAGERVEVELFVGGDAWLERLLLRLGPHAEVVEPPELRSLAAQAARRVLRRYGA